MADSQVVQQDSTAADAAAEDRDRRGPARVVTPDLEFVRRIREAGGDSVKKCFQCATCSVTCELAPADAPFPRKEMLWAQWGLKDRLLTDPDVFLCYQCNDCSTRCPRGARPGDVLAAVRAMVYRTYAFPSFMGRALASPGALVPLFILPVVVLFALLFVQHSGGEGFGASMAHLFANRDVTYGEFLEHGVLEGLFIAGNVLIFLLAAVGFVRYWRALRDASPRETRMGFVPAAVATLGEIVAHRRFGSCGQNAPRRTAHMLVVFGFLGAAATAGLALIYLLLGGGELSLANPIKWLGVASGAAMVVGSLMIVMRRAQDPDVGAEGYADRLFLWMVLAVAVTGLLTWILRLAAVPAVAYPLYFVHLTFVFFLLWYMPYSKFAHMIYRALALVWANQTGRIEPAARTAAAAPAPPAAGAGGA